MLRPSRENRGEDRLFAVKTLLLVTAASLGIAGMMYRIEWLIWAAIAVVAAGIILRLIADRKRMDD
jgi:4-hydroxybenzoate polyprenyltransferase